MSQIRTPKYEVAVLCTFVLLGSDSQPVSYFTVPPRAHPSTGSQSGSATPGLLVNKRDKSPSTRQLAYSLVAPGRATQLSLLGSNITTAKVTFVPPPLR